MRLRPVLDWSVRSGNLTSRSAHMVAQLRSVGRCQWKLICAVLLRHSDQMRRREAHGQQARSSRSHRRHSEHVRGHSAQIEALRRGHRYSTMNSSMSAQVVRAARALARVWVTAMFVAAGCSGAVAAWAAEPVMRCGWFDNPTPGNAWLHDRDGEWTIGIQGGHRATGLWPRFRSSEWVRTGHGSAGYGCACLKLQADSESRDVAHILSAHARPLATCRKDSALKRSEPDNPLR